MKSVIISALAAVALAAPKVVTVEEYRTDCETATGTYPPGPSDDPYPDPPVPIEPARDVATIQQQAHGTLPNGALPSEISDSSALIWQLIAANELFEVEYFTFVYGNLVNRVAGYDDVEDYGAALDAIAAIRAQEQIHAIAANAVLQTAGRPTISPCNYTFPVTDFETSVAFAQTFTDVVLGILGEVSLAFGTNGDSAFLPILSSVIGSEAEQVGWFRNLQGKIPSAQPFLSAASAVFGWSLLNQLVIVPGSCAASDLDQIPILPPLTIVTSPVDETTTEIEFSVSSADATGYSIVYINQQNTPIVEAITNVQTNGNTTTFTAPFPYGQFLMNGLTIAAVTQGAGPFASAGEVASNSLFGPGIIEIM